MRGCSLRSGSLALLGEPQAPRLGLGAVASDRAPKRQRRGGRKPKSLGDDRGPKCEHRRAVDADYIAAGHRGSFAAPFQWIGALPESGQVRQLGKALTDTPGFDVGNFSRWSQGASER